MILSSGASLCHIRIWFLTAIVLALASSIWFGKFLSYCSIHLELSLSFGWTRFSSSPTSRWVSAFFLFFLRRLPPVSLSLASLDWESRRSGSWRTSKVKTGHLQVGQDGFTCTASEMHSLQKVCPHYETKSRLMDWRETPGGSMATYLGDPGIDR